MKKYAIEFRRKIREPLELWAHFDGTRKNALKSARGLLFCLKEEIRLPHARVYVDGKAIRKMSENSKGGNNDSIV